MTLAVFDIGGSSVKAGLWDDNSLSQKSQFDTPNTFEELQEQLKRNIEQYGETIEGVAISAPGAVNVEERKIEGISAVPYIHHRPIFDELEVYLDLPITIENDANCAGICEVEIGAGQEAENAIFVVIGSGVGGAIFINGKIYKGSHLFGGEFGLIKNQNGHILSQNGTAVNTAKRYAEKFGQELTGKELFVLKDAGYEDATEMIEFMYQNLAEALYNIQVSIDPEMIIVGGGISARDELISELESRLFALLEEEGISAIMPKVCACEYQNDANLIGAALNFENLNIK